MSTRPAAPPTLRGRLLRRPTAIVCMCYLLVVIGTAVLAPILLPGVSTENAGDLLRVRELPGAEHLLGTDTLGRDVLERLLVGTRVTIVGVAEALVVVLLIGVPFGMLAAYYGGWIDRVVTWVSDLTFALPSIIIVLVVLSTFPQSMTAAMITLGVLLSPALMRIVRSSALEVRHDLYISAAQVSGLSDGYIIFRHVLPRISGAVIVQISLISATALLVQSGLAYLNLVVPAPAPSWGGMIAEGASVILQQPWLIWPPGVAIALTAGALGLLAEVVRDIMTDQWSGASQLPASPRRTGVSTSDDAGDEFPTALLSVERLRVEFAHAHGSRTAIDDVSFRIDAGETVVLVGESGCGKTLTSTAVLGLLPGSASITGGRVVFEGRDLAGLSEKQLSAVRGRKIGFVSQEPMVSLNPSFRIGWQLAELLKKHRGLSRRDAAARTLELLRLVRIPDPVKVSSAYPHELSGGMAQRVSIARALAGDPDLLIADEPTTALDVTVQAEILELLRDIQKERAMAVLLVTHDWGVVADLADRVVVMYAGQVIEDATADEIFHAPRHPYTRALLKSNPQSLSDQDGYLPAIGGTVPRPGEWPKGCHFAPRCHFATDECRSERIPTLPIAPDHLARCIRLDEVSAADRDAFVSAAVKENP